MSEPRRTPDIAALLEHMDWMRGLALSLARDEATAHDVLQETWLASLQKPPRGRGPRAWLAKVLRNFAQRSRRSEMRRASRERSAARREWDAETPAKVFERAEVQVLVAQAVLCLEEPYRSAVLLHYFDGLTVAEVAVAQGVPAATVYTRLRRAREMLRQKLDRSCGEDRTDWRRVVLIFLDPKLTTASPSAALVSKLGAAGLGTLTWGALSMTAKQLGVALVCLAGVLLGLWWILSGLPEPERGPAAGVAASEASSPSRSGAPSETSDRTEGTKGETAAAGEGPGRRQRTPSISGVVTDPDGRELAGAQLLVVRLDSWEPLATAGSEISRASYGDLSPLLHQVFGEYSRVGEQLPRARADGKGVYSFHDLPGGAYRVLARHGGYLPSTEGMVFVTVAETARHDVVLTKGCAISGRVIDGEGQPVAGATIAAEASDRRRLRGDAEVRQLLEEWRNGLFLIGDAQAKSRPTGEFVVESLGFRSHDLIVRKKGFAETRLLDVPVDTGALTVVLGRGLSVRGRLLDAAGEPVGGVRLVLRQESLDKLAPPAMGEPISPRTLVPRDLQFGERAIRPEEVEQSSSMGASSTGPSSTGPSSTGEFTFTGLGPGLYLIALRDRRWPPREERVRVQDAPVDLGDIVIEMGVVLSGRVVGPGGGPVPGARVWIDAPLKAGLLDLKGGLALGPRPNLLPLVEAEAGADGKFSLGPLVPGVYTLRVWSERFVPADFPGLEAGGEEVELSLGEGACVRGRVLDALSGSPIAGAAVVVAREASDNPALRKRATSVEDGGFEIPGLESGKATLAVSHAGHERASTAVELLEEQPFFLETRLAPLGSLEGRVLSASGSTVAGALVWADLSTESKVGPPGENAPVPRYARSGVDGRFSLKLPLSAGRGGVALAAEHPVFGSGRVDSLQPTGESDDPLPRIEIVLREYAVLSGTVTDSGGGPIAAAPVRLKNMVRSSGVDRLIFTSATGGYIALRLEPGAWRMEVEAAGFAGWISEALAIQDGENTQDVVLERGLSLEGRVVDAKGTGVAGAEVFALEPVPEDRREQQRGSFEEYRRHLRQENGIALATARTDAGGFYRLGRLPPREVSVFARAPGYRSSPMVVVQPEGGGTADLRLTELATLWGSVKDAETGRPVGTFGVELNAVWNKGMLGGPGTTCPRTFPSPTGEFLFEGLEPGGHFVAVRAEGYSGWISEVALEAGKDARVEVLLERGEVVRGRVSSAVTDLPIPGAKIRVIPRGAWWVGGGATSGPDGTFSITGIGNGSFHLQVEHPHYTPEVNGMVLHVAGPGTPPLEIRMLPKGHLQGRTEFPGRRDASKLEVLIRRPGRTEPEFRAEVGADGSFRIPYVPRGTYEVDLEESMVPGKEPILKHLGTVEIPPGEAVDLEKTVE